MLKVQCKNPYSSVHRYLLCQKTRWVGTLTSAESALFHKGFFSLRPLHLMLHFRSTFSQLWGNIALALHICARKSFQTLTKICQEVWLIIQQTLLARGTLLQKVRNFQGRCIQVEAVSTFYWSVHLGVIFTRMKPPKKYNFCAWLVACKFHFDFILKSLAKSPVANTETRYNLYYRHRDIDLKFNFGVSFKDFVSWENRDSVLNRGNVKILSKPFRCFSPNIFYC